jgi:hypothetical protein
MIEIGPALAKIIGMSMVGIICIVALVLNR